MTETKLPPGSILLAGIPATGKSTFGNWLEQTQGYFHLDFDEEALVQQRGFGNEQDLLWHHGVAEPLYRALLARQQPIVLTWGFAVQFLPLVEQILSWGLTPVWFSATRQAARSAFLQRGGIDVKFFDQHMDLIEAVHTELMRVFGRTVIQTLRDDGSRMCLPDISAALSAMLFGPARSVAPTEKGVSE